MADRKNGSPNREDAIARWRNAASADEIVPYHAVWSYSIVLDAVFMASDLLDDYGELLWVLDPSSNITSRIHLESVQLDARDDVIINNLRYALSSPFRDDGGDFRIHDSDGKSLYAADSGLRIAALSLKAEQSLNRRPDVLAAAQQSRSFMERVATTQDARDGMYSATPNAAPTVFGAFTAVSSAVQYRRLSKSLGRGRSRLRMQLAAVVEALFQKEFTSRVGNTFAFKRASTPDGCVSTTSYVLRIASMLEELVATEGTIGDELRNKLIRRSDSIVNFLRECWDDQSGGFKANPHERSANLGHTRHALQVIRTFREWGCVDPAKLQWLDAARVGRFLNECWAGSSSPRGFDITPGGDAPSIYALRSAINCFKVLEVLRHFEDIPAHGDYEAERTQSKRRLKTVFRQGVAPYRNSEEGYYAFPVRVVQQWKRELEDAARASCKRALLEVLPEQVPATRPLKPTLGAICGSYASGDYLVQHKQLEFSVQHALQGDLARLCYDDEPVEPAFVETKQVVDSWERPPVSGERTPSPLLDRLKDANIIGSDPKGGLHLHTTLHGLPSSVAHAFGAYTDVKVAEAGKNILDTIGTEVEVLPSREAVLEAAIQIFRDAGDGDVYVFSSVPWLLLPGVHGPSALNASPTWYLQESTKKYLRAYQSALNNGSSTGRIHYSFDISAYSTLIQQGYNDALPEDRFGYLKSAVSVLSDAISREKIDLHWYLLQPADWRGFFSVISRDRLLLVLRDGVDGDFQAVTLDEATLLGIVQRIIWPGRSRTGLGKDLIDKWCRTVSVRNGRSEANLSLLAQILTKPTRKIAGAVNPRRQAWMFIASRIGGIANPDVVEHLSQDDLSEMRYWCEGLIRKVSGISRTGVSNEDLPELLSIVRFAKRISERYPDATTSLTLYETASEAVRGFYRARSDELLSEARLAKRPMTRVERHDFMKLSYYEEKFERYSELGDLEAGADALVAEIQELSKKVREAFSLP